MTKANLGDLKLTKIPEPEKPVVIREEKPISDKRKMSLYVSERLWRELKLRAIDEHRDVNAILNDAARRYLDSSSGI